MPLSNRITRDLKLVFGAGCRLPPMTLAKNLRLFLTVSCVGCGGIAEESFSPTLTYRGPAVTVREAPGAAETHVTAPTGGFRLRRDGLETDGDLLKIRYTLEEPGPDEMVTQALEVLTDEVALPSGVRRVQVFVARIQRNVHYLVAPAHELAAILEN
jgi:hypothetical protein